MLPFPNAEAYFAVENIASLNLWVILVIGITNCSVVMLTVATCAGPKQEVDKHDGNVNMFL